MVPKEPTSPPAPFLSLLRAQKGIVGTPQALTTATIEPSHPCSSSGSSSCLHFSTRLLRAARSARERLSELVEEGSSSPGGSSPEEDDTVLSARLSSGRKPPWQRVLGSRELLGACSGSDWESTGHGSDPKQSSPSSLSSRKSPVLFKETNFLGLLCSTTFLRLLSTLLGLL